MLQTPFYDPEKSYEENLSNGPFGAFADGKTLEGEGDAQFDFLGLKVNSTFGIPAGPLINANFCKAAFEKGFDICVYKTVRSGTFPCHPMPNIVPLEVDGDLTIEKLGNPVFSKTSYDEPLTITNSFGVPQTRQKKEWQDDVKMAMSYAGKGQVLVLSFMGTVRPGQTQEDFINDNILAAREASETGAKILEINLSCPNIGNEGLVCYNTLVSEQILKGVREVIGQTPLIVKVGYYKDDVELRKIAKVVNTYANSISAINTLQATVLDKEGHQALPGEMRLKSGVCGAGIKWAGLDMVRRLKSIKEENGYTFSIEGVGGVMNASDFMEYKAAGADSVMSATGAMWNPYLAKEIKELL